MNRKKQIRENFRNAVFGRDNYKCVMCSKDAKDAHHIGSRDIMPAGGYVKENGISLCERCHIRAEQFHVTGVAYPGYSPEDLYKKINSSYDKAVMESRRL